MIFYEKALIKNDAIASLIKVFSFEYFPQFVTSTFQAVLITDGSDSYAVFIYQCGGMGWGGATIGWSYSISLYEEHSLSEGSNSDDIGCRYSSTSSAIIYDVYSGKRTTCMYIAELMCTQSPPFIACAKQGHTQIPFTYI